MSFVCASIDLNRVHFRLLFFRRNPLQCAAMKILHVYKDYFPILGGIEGNVQQIAAHQVANGHDVSVLVTNPSNLPARETINEVKVIRAHRLATVASTPLSVTFPVLLARQKPDIAHLHFPYPVGEVSQLFFGRKTPYVFTYHSDIVKQQTILRLYGPLLKRVLANAAQIMPTSPNYIRSSSWLQPLAHKCTAVPLGIDPTPYLNAQPLDKYSSAVPTILFVGRHRHYKGVNVLIEAMQHVSGARLLIGGDGPLRADYEVQASGLNLGDKVQFLGNIPQDELASLYASVDLFVLPSINRAEAFGIVLMEAMASGLPCISTELSTGTSFIVDDGTTGRVVLPSQPKRLAEAINQLIQNPNRRAALGAAGRQRILDQFTIQHMVARIQAVYEQVLRVSEG